MLDNTDAFVDAMAADFGTRSRAASLFTEVVGMIPVIEHTRSHVAEWMRPTKLMRGGRLFGLRAEVESTPLGVVGIIGPWNFPLNLVVLPAAAAFAAGNRVMIKMSEVTPRTAELMERLAPEVLRPRRTRRRHRRSGRRGRVRRRCRSTICSSPARRRSAPWCNGPPRRTWSR